MGVVIGTAGWSIARKDADAFSSAGTVLERYSCLFDGVEINSSFYRAHRPSTWARWAASVPPLFRFAVKVPRTITHQAKLVDVDALTARFVSEIEPLGGKLAVLLVQLPPKLGFDASVAGPFFSTLRGLVDANIVCEPRHVAWFDDEADAMLGDLQIARVAADPAICPAAGEPGGWRGLSYWRLHGSPAMYRSAYSEDAITSYAQKIRAAISDERNAWCVFDNTALSAATSNALSLRAMLSSGMSVS